MGVPENIDALLVKYDITQDCLARIAGCSPAAVTKWRRGAHPGKAYVDKITDYFNLTDDDIYSDNYGLAAKEHGRFCPEGAIRAESCDMVEVPLLGRVHAGPLSSPDDLSEKGETVSIPSFLLKSDPSCYALESEGDCMNKVYPEGCIIVVSPNKQPQNGSVAVAMVDGHEAVMRRMYKTQHTLVLSPESFNPEHSDIVVTADSERTVELVGTVVWFQSNGEME